VVGEAARLTQALDNLIANALEHGGGRVLLEGERQGDSVRVKISDGGPGLRQPPLGLSRRRPRSGRGHGLAIATDVVEAHGGKLVAGLGRHGPAIVVELPRERPAEHSLAARTRRSARPPGAPVAASSRAGGGA
jgi:signal transduction histidine kinase